MWKPYELTWPCNGLDVILHLLTASFTRDLTPLWPSAALGVLPPFSLYNFSCQIHCTFSQMGLKQTHIPMKTRNCTNWFIRTPSVFSTTHQLPGSLISSLWDWVIGGLQKQEWNPRQCLCLLNFSGEMHQSTFWKWHLEVNKYFHCNGVFTIIFFCIYDMVACNSQYSLHYFNATTTKSSCYVLRD